MRQVGNDVCDTASVRANIWRFVRYFCRCICCCQQTPGEHLGLPQAVVALIFPGILSCWLSLVDLSWFCTEIVFIGTAASGEPHNMCVCCGLSKATQAGLSTAFQRLLILSVYIYIQYILYVLVCFYDHSSNLYMVIMCISANMHTPIRAQGQLLMFTRTVNTLLIIICYDSIESSCNGPVMNVHL